MGIFWNGWAGQGAKGRERAPQHNDGGVSGVDLPVPKDDCPNRWCGHQHDPSFFLIGLQIGMLSEEIRQGDLGFGLEN